MTFQMTIPKNSILFSGFIWFFYGLTATVCAEESKNLLTDGGFEAPVKIIRENPEKGHIVTKGWMFLRGRNGNARKWKVTTENAVEGKRCFKMTNPTGEGNMHLKMLPEHRVSKFHGPYRVSCRIKMQGRTNPAKIPVQFCIRGRNKGSGSNAKYRIAEIKDETDWTEYSAVVYRKDVPFKAQSDLWFVSILVAGLKGTVWVDDVRVIPVDAPALCGELNFKECFLWQKQVVVQGQVNPKHLTLRKSPLEIALLDFRGNVIHKKRIIIKSKKFTVPLDIAELSEGRYTVKISAMDKKGKMVILEREFRRVSGPFSFRPSE